MNSAMNLLAQTLESSVFELLELQRVFEHDGDLPFYAGVLLLYLRGETAELAHFLEDYADRPLSSYVRELGRLRLALRQESPVDLANKAWHETASQIVATLKKIPPRALAKTDRDLWIGEAYFVQGLRALAAFEPAEALQPFRQASYHFERGGALKKGAKAWLNVVVSQSRVRMDARLILEYQFVVDKARRAGNHAVEGVAHLNLSREYQLIRAMDLALKHADLAIAGLRVENGSSQHYLAITHKCHLLLETRQTRSAEILLQETAHSPLKEVQAAVEFLRQLTQASFQGRTLELEAYLEPTWRQRVEQWRRQIEPVAVTEPLRPLEQQLIEALGQGPRAKDELIAMLYGTRIDNASAENRFKVQLSRLNRRHPELIPYRQRR
ncbi:MAG: hypothetical protein AB7P04_11585, partial [Bacteriovoracia bacterium]